MYPTVSEIIQSLHIADALTVGEILHSKGVYSTLQSARVNAQKKLNELVALEQLIRGDGYYRTPDCRSQYKEHARLITQTLSEVLKLPLNSVIHREISTPVGLRPDAIILLTKDNRGLCLILEVVNHETEAYLEQKINTWNNWPEAGEFLSKLFRYRIPHYEIVTVTDLVGFSAYLQGVI